MKNVAGKISKKKKNTYFICDNNFFSENRAFYEIMWKNAVEPNKPQMTLWCVSIVSWIPNATNTNSKLVILTAFPLQQLLD
jgi:hypothetical protein